MGNNLVEHIGTLNPEPQAGDLGEALTLTLNPKPRSLIQGLDVIGFNKAINACKKLAWLKWFGV